MPKKIEIWDYKLRDIYFAGLLDGEAHFGHTYSVGTSGNRYGPYLVISVRMTCHDVVCRLYEHFRLGRVTPIPPRQEGYLPQWEWRVHGRQARIVARRLLPYMIVQRTKVELLLEPFKHLYP